MAHPKAKSFQLTIPVSFAIVHSFTTVSW